MFLHRTYVFLAENRGGECAFPSKPNSMTFVLIFDPAVSAEVDDRVLPLAGDLISHTTAYTPQAASNLDPAAPVMCYLSDEQLKALLPKLSNQGFQLAVLPHKQALEACKGLGVGRSLEKAIAHFKGLANKESPEPVKTDILYCNHIPVFNSLVIGQTFRLTSEEPPERKGILGKKAGFLSRFFNIRPFRVEVDLPNDRKLKTAVSGIVVSEHRKSSLLSSLLLEDSAINDGMMHAFLISPRSVISMFYFAMGSLWQGSKLPPFGAHIKTTALTFTFPHGERDYLVDNRKFTGSQVKMHVQKQPLEVFPGAYLELPAASRPSQEVFKTSALPSGEAAEALASGTLPVIRHASSDEFKELFKVLRENAQLKSSFVVLMVLSTLIATFGLFADSTPVVIGAMILAPLMSPIISLSMGTLRQDRKLIWNSMSTILAGMGVAVLSAVLLTWLTPIQAAGAEILERTRPNLLDLGIAVLSGVAGAYAHAREEVAKTLAGVAIAVALIPPLAVSAIGLAWLNWTIFSGATLLLFTNLAGMVLAAAVTFMLMGFSPLKLATKGMIISLTLVIALSIPLALSFNQMVREHHITKEVEEVTAGNVTIREVKVINLNPLRLSLILVSENPLDDHQISEIKNEIEKQIQQEVHMEITTAISR